MGRNSKVWSHSLTIRHSHPLLVEAYTVQPWQCNNLIILLNYPYNSTSGNLTHDHIYIDQKWHIYYVYKNLNYSIACDSDIFLKTLNIY